ncbi:MAG: transcriptional repressor [bacterium]|nr:transcriptional repressor [bacterium]
MSHCKIEDQLTELNLRKTKDRHLLLELFEQARTWSVSQLAKKMKSDLSTIYRNIRAFEEAGLVEKVYEQNGEAVFEKTSETHHDHLVCDNCSSGTCVPCPAPTTQKHHLQIFGICKTCRN